MGLLWPGLAFAESKDVLPMPTVGSEIDANFYRLIHQSLIAARDQGLERRGEKRHMYRTTQRIAPADGSKFPDDGEFVPIQCRDLTRNGFSFLTAEEPRYRTLVVEFGLPPDVIYVAARVMRCVPAMCYPTGLVAQMNGDDQAAALAAPPGEQGTPMFLVGCRFTRRLSKPS